MKSEACGIHFRANYVQGAHANDASPGAATSRCQQGNDMLLYVDLPIVMTTKVKHYAKNQAKGHAHEYKGRSYDGG